MELIRARCVITILLKTDESICTSHTNIIVAHKTVESVVSRIDKNLVFGRPTFKIVANETSS